MEIIVWEYSNGILEDIEYKMRILQRTYEKVINISIREEKNVSKNLTNSKM